MGRNKLSEKKRRDVQVPVYFTRNEEKQIRKKAGLAVLGESPFIRKIIIEALNIKTEEDL